MSPTDEVAQELIKSLHGRADGFFLPISVRQNRIEDIFVHFLEWLRPEDTETREDRQARTAEDSVEFLMERMLARNRKFRLPANAQGQALLRRWLHSEVIISPRASNRISGDAVSILPLHSAVAKYFYPRGKLPPYGRFICDLLGRQDDGSFDDELLRQLRGLFAQTHGDPVASLLAAALEDDEAGETAAKFEAQADAFSRERLVWSTTQARLFQTQIRSLVPYSPHVGRRTFVDWAYAVLAFFLASYILRMARAAEDYGAWLEHFFDNGIDSWDEDVDGVRFAPRIPYGHRDESHARLLKRLPQYTSQLIIAREYAKLATGEQAEPTVWGLCRQLQRATSAVDANEVFDQLVARYPTTTSGMRGFKLPDGDKCRLVELGQLAGTSPFVLATVLNFEDMARSSNNVREWQFYSSLAKHKKYGFARRGRTGDVLQYQASETLLVALAHCHVHQVAGQPTLLSFKQYLENLGFEFDAVGRNLLETQLIELGMLESLSDATDAKYLTPLFRIPEEV